jgi:hypothetical protein
MTYHVWGDNWGHWEELYKAIDWIQVFYGKATGEYLVAKEKYGTMRYELLYVILEKRVNLVILLDIVRRATKRFPKVAPELVDDLLDTLIPNQDTLFYMGYFQAVIDHCPDTSDVLENLP